MTDANDTATGTADSNDESPVIQTLRKENKELASKAKKLDELLAEKATARVKQAEEVVNALQLGDTVKDDLLDWIEGDINVANATEALKARFPNLSFGEEAPAAEPQGEVQTQENVVPASSVGQQVAAAADGSDNRDLQQKILESESDAEMVELLAAVGGVVSYG